MKLSIIVPAHNEAKTVRQILEQTAKAPTPGYEKEIIVVNDGSTDQTEQILQDLGPKLNLTLARHNKNLGKGAALKTGFSLATGDLIIIQDADLEYDPNDYAAILAKFNNSKVQVVYGARTYKSPWHGYFRYIVGGAFVKGLVAVLYGAVIEDIFTCYKCFRAPLLRSLDPKGNGFDIETEITAKLLKRKIKIGSVPIKYHPRTFGEGKHIRAIDGLIGILTLLKYRFK